MDRLTCLIALLTASVCSSVCCGQETSPYTIAGDVRAPGNFFFHGWQQVDLSDLLHRGNPLSDSGNALILRGQPLAVVTSVNVQQNRLLRQTPLQPGDIVMFRRFEGGPTGNGTAIVAHGGIPTVVSFSGGPLPLFEVLESLQIQTSQPVSMVRAEWGELQVSLLNQNELVRHGDVLDLTSSADGQQFAQTPVVSESTDGFQSLLNNANLSRTVSDEGSAESAIEITDQPDAFHESKANSGVPSLIVPGLNFDSPDSGEAAEDEATTFVNSSLILPETSDSPDPEIGSDRQQSDDASPMFRNASLQRPAEVSETAAMQDRVSGASAETASNGVWNGIFVVGLLMAVALIVAGWIKTGQERRMEEQELGGSAAQSLRGEHSGTAVTATPANEELTPTGTWQSNMFPEPITVYPQVVDSEQEVQLKEEASEISTPFSEAEIEASEIEEILAAEHSQVSRRTLEEQDFLRPSNAQTTDMPASENSTSAASEPTAAVIDTAAVTPQAVDLLDDLIHNRLPLELSETQLPLQIAIYGRPNGPRRLRIDAAHGQIAPPHMATVERRAQRRDPVMATHKTQTHVSQKSQQAQTSSRTDVPASTPPYAATPSSAAMQPAEDVSRFDRALNFLKEQSER